ncbi:hypothetical protein [Actinoplanes regularis]|uniref:hypothetical protein n=1 Tax=Actinoplanes regularis TaxID=52697 RepID=UPI0011787A42|nr:hypothetical protein [Actinoplanes regularis]
MMLVESFRRKAQPISHFTIRWHRAMAVTQVVNSVVVQPGNSFFSRPARLVNAHRQRRTTDVAWGGGIVDGRGLRWQVAVSVTDVVGAW